MSISQLTLHWVKRFPSLEKDILVSQFFFPFRNKWLEAKYSVIFPWQVRGIHWCSWVGRGIVREQWLAEEWNRMALSGLDSKLLWAQFIMPIGEPVSQPCRCLTLNITPGSNWHLISLYITTTESNSKVVRIQKMTTYSRNSWLFYTTSLSIPFQMYREQYEEYAYWS